MMASFLKVSDAIAASFNQTMIFRRSNVNLAMTSPADFDRRAVQSCRNVATLSGNRSIARHGKLDRHARSVGLPDIPSARTNAFKSFVVQPSARSEILAVFCRPRGSSTNFCADNSHVSAL
jgi:hypothetical protein